jgi:hypothetical protein
MSKVVKSVCLVGVGQGTNKERTVMFLRSNMQPYKKLWHF